MSIQKSLPPNFQPVHEKKRQLIKSYDRDDNCDRELTCLPLNLTFCYTCIRPRTYFLRWDLYVNELVRGTFIIGVYGRKFYLSLAFSCRKITNKAPRKQLLYCEFRKYCLDKKETHDH